MSNYISNPSPIQRAATAAPKDCLTARQRHEWTMAKARAARVAHHHETLALHEGLSLDEADRIGAEVYREQVELEARELGFRGPR